MKHRDGIFWTISRSIFALRNSSSSAVCKPKGGSRMYVLGGEGEYEKKLIDGLWELYQKFSSGFKVVVV